MFDFNLKKKMMSYLPYGAILYLLCGGGSMPDFANMDMGVAGYVVEQVETKVEGGGIKDLYNKVVGAKDPAQGNMPGKASFSGAQKRQEPNDNVVQQFLNTLIRNMPTGRGTTNYGY